MSRNAKKIEAPAGSNNSGMEAPLLTPGAYPARVVQVVFVGVQEQRPFKGQAKDPIDEVRITYELSEEFMQDADGNDLEDKPRWFTESIPFHSLEVDRARSTKRYNAIDPNDTCDGDFGKLLGLPCQVVLVNNKGKANPDKIYTNITDVTPAPNMRGYTQPDLVNDTFYFDPQDDNVDVEAFRGLPEWLQEVITKALDFKDSPLAAKIGGDTPPESDTDEGDKEEIY